jgi:hypothetical protein
MRKSALIAIVAFAFTSPTLAQQPTATEAFNLSIRCRQMADAKMQSMFIPIPNDTESFKDYLSQYDASRNRCYIAIVVHRPAETTRQIYDVVTDDLLAGAYIRNGRQSGMVTDPQSEIIGGMVSWDVANDYITKLMSGRK